MIQRCTNPKHPRYADWGGRGITIDPRWLSFGNFLADMGEPPRGTTLNRKDNNGPYVSWNCEWATAARQQMNRRGVRLTPAVVQEIKLLSEDGLTMTEIGKQLRMGRHTVAKALFGQS